MSLLQEIEQYGLADCEFNRELLKNPIGAYACIQFEDEAETIEGYYFSFGDLTEYYEYDSYGVPDTHIFYYCNGGGEEEMKSLMVDGAEDFKVLSYELIYDISEV
jgi:hypothetical protein